MSENKYKLITKNAICKIIAEKTGCKVKDIYSIVGLLMDEMQRELAHGRPVKIKNFGSFELRQMKPRKSVSIQTGKLELRHRRKVLRFILNRNFSRYLSKIRGNYGT